MSEIVKQILFSYSIKKFVISEELWSDATIGIHYCSAIKKPQHSLCHPVPDKFDEELTFWIVRWLGTCGTCASI